MYPVLSGTSFFAYLGNIRSCLDELCVKRIGVLYSFQSERKEILRRLNHNLKAYPSKEEEEQEPAPLKEPGPTPQACQPVTDERPQTGGDRRRWETGAPPVLSVAQHTLEDTCSTMAGTNNKSELKVCRCRFEQICGLFLHFPSWFFFSLISVSDSIFRGTSSLWWGQEEVAAWWCSACCGSSDSGGHQYHYRRCVSIGTCT